LVAVLIRKLLILLGIDLISIRRVRRDRKTLRGDRARPKSKHPERDACRVVETLVMTPFVLVLCGRPLTPKVTVAPCITRLG